MHAAKLVLLVCTVWLLQLGCNAERCEINQLVLANVFATELFMFWWPDEVPRCSVA